MTNDEILTKAIEICRAQIVVADDAPSSYENAGVEKCAQALFQYRDAQRKAAMKTGIGMWPNAPSAAPEAALMTWQPIETAPKDVNIILTDGVSVCEGGWLTDVEQGADYEGQGGMAGWWGVDLRGTPTLWMPLPPLPQKGSPDAS